MLEKRNEELLISFVGRNSDYYLEKWNSIKSTKNIFTWNWSAFFFHIFWFSYRKMYYYAYVLIGIVFFRIYIVSKFELPKAINFTLKYLIWIAVGALANHFYLKHAEKMIKEMASNVGDESELRLSLAHRGGVSSISAILSVGIFLFLLLLPFLLREMM